LIFNKEAEKDLLKIIINRILISFSIQFKYHPIPVEGPRPQADLATPERENVLLGGAQINFLFFFSLGYNISFFATTQQCLLKGRSVPVTYTSLRVMIDTEGPLSKFSNSLAGGVHISARALIDI
jgi:hypothetical protein